MVKILIATALLLSGSVAMAVDRGLLLENRTIDGTAGVVQKIVAAIPEIREPGKSKFVYAELIYQRTYGEEKCLVYGKTVSEAVKKSVSQVKYRDEALELMGAEGWELASTVTREYTGGFEIFFYFKKPVE